MKKLVTLAAFNNTSDIKYSLLKNMLEEAGINYIATDVNTWGVLGLGNFIAPTIKVYDNDLEEASKILKSIF